MSSRSLQVSLGIDFGSLERPFATEFIMFSARLLRGLIHSVDLVADQQMIVAMIDHQQLVDGPVDRRRVPLR